MINRRRMMNFIAGVLEAIALIIIFFICPLLWLFEKDILVCFLVLISCVLIYVSACVWSSKAKN